MSLISADSPAIPAGCHHAAAEVSAATGLRFQDDGATSEAPSEHRTTYQDDRYGKRWAPVLIAWSNPEETPGLAGSIAGLGGTRRRLPDIRWCWWRARWHWMRRPEGPAHVRAVIMHELGHVVGLDHVADSSQLMNAENSGLTDFAAGDRAGLALLGSGRCVPQL